jgi:hypothetical protein
VTNKVLDYTQRRRLVHGCISGQHEPLFAGLVGKKHWNGACSRVEAKRLALLSE